MNTNKVTFIASITVITLLLVVPTIYKVSKNHNDNLTKVAEDKIIASAKKCYYEGKCSDNKIYLKELYDKKYLDKISNPITKEYYNENSYIEIKNDEFKFIQK
mgnify:FL=1